MVRSRNLLAAAVFALMAAGVSAQTTHSVTQSNLSFFPFNTDLRVGDTVVWTWTNFGDHDVTEGDDGIIDAGDAFSEPLTPAITTATILFDKALFDACTVNPGNIVNYVCTPHFDFGMVGTLTFEPWIDLGKGLAGTGAITPTLDGTGPMTGGSNNTLEFGSMLAGSTVFITVGIAELCAPFKGGFLVPDLLLDPIALPTGAGSFSLPFVMPGGVPFGVSLYLQGWIQDAGGPVGFSSTNGLQAHLP